MALSQESLAEMTELPELSGVNLFFSWTQPVLWGSWIPECQKKYPIPAWAHTSPWHDGTI